MQYLTDGCEVKFEWTFTVHYLRYGLIRKQDVYLLKHFIAAFSNEYMSCTVNYKFRNRRGNRIIPVYRCFYFFYMGFYFRHNCFLFQLFFVRCCFNYCSTLFCLDCFLIVNCSNLFFIAPIGFVGFRMMYYSFIIFV